MKLNNDKAYKIVSNLLSIEAVLLKHKTQVHIAVIIKRGKIIEIASNSIGSRSKGAGYDDITIHAERAVLKKVGDVSKLYGATLVVIRIMRGTLEIGNSEPCHTCKRHLEKCIKKHGLRCVYYSA